MPTDPTRREFLRVSTLAALSATATQVTQARSDDELAEPIHVVVWDERQPEQKQAYENFLGNQIASYLKDQPGLSVRSVGLDDPEQGLSDEVMADCDVLIWWGHARQAEITPETGKRLVSRIVEGSLSLIALHSAHWSTPFVEAMNERALRDVEQIYHDLNKEDYKIELVPPPKRYTVPGRDARLTPYVHVRKFDGGRREIDVHLPYCCFPAYRNDGQPSTLRVLKPDHAIVRGIPAESRLPQTEMYDEPFHVPEPDEVVLEEYWSTGEWFRSGMIWQLGKGHVFYFRPGHETYPVYKEKVPLQILANAVRWLASRAG